MKATCACGHRHEPTSLGTVSGYLICNCSGQCWNTFMTVIRIGDQMRLDDLLPTAAPDVPVAGTNGTHQGARL